MRPHVKYLVQYGYKLCLFVVLLSFVHMLCFCQRFLTKLCGSRKEMSGSEKEQDGDVESEQVDGEELMCKQFP